MICSNASQRRRRSGAEEEAVRLFRSSLASILLETKDREDRAYLRQQAGQFFLTRGSFEDAAEHLDSLTRTDPHRYDAFYLLGIARARSGRGPEAIGAVEEAMRRTPAAEYGKRSRGYLILSSVYEQQGQREEAEAALREALRLDPENRAAREALERLTNENIP
ncbi:MAG: tetratricopeptide repeat protein [Candidatus Eisenbacteria bacterium]